MATFLQIGADPADWADDQGRHPLSIAPIAPAWKPASPTAVLQRFPAACANGHPLTHPNILLSFQPCRCRPGETGHSVTICATCDHRWLYPAHLNAESAPPLD